MIGADETLVLPPVQPKSFTHTSPRNNTDVYSPTNITLSPKTLGGTKSTSKKLGLSLRRITPDAKKSNSTHHHHNVNDGASSTGGSFVSRLTGRSRTSINTGMTPKTRNGSTTSQPISPTRRGGGGTNVGTSRSPHRNNIEKKQKMEDEYYRPSMHWADSDESSEEELDDGELPSLKKVNSRGSARSWRSANNNNNNAARLRAYNDEYYSEEQGEEQRYVPPSAAAAAAAASAASIGVAVVSPTNNTPKQGGASAEQLKVAGFWSQLDDDDDNGDAGSTAVTSIVPKAGKPKASKTGIEPEPST